MSEEEENVRGFRGIFKGPPSRESSVGRLPKPPPPQPAPATKDPPLRKDSLETEPRPDLSSVLIGTKGLLPLPGSPTLSSDPASPTGTSADRSLQSFPSRLGLTATTVTSTPRSPHRNQFQVSSPVKKGGAPFDKLEASSADQFAKDRDSVLDKKRVKKDNDKQKPTKGAAPEISASEMATRSVSPPSKTAVERSTKVKKEASKSPSRRTVSRSPSPRVSPARRLNSGGGVSSRSSTPSPSPFPSQYAPTSRPTSTRSPTPTKASKPFNGSPSHRFRSNPPRERTPQRTPSQNPTPRWTGNLTPWRDRELKKKKKRIKEPSTYSQTGTSSSNSSNSSSELIKRTAVTPRRRDCMSRGRSDTPTSSRYSPRRSISRPMSGYMDCTKVRWQQHDGVWEDSLCDGRGRASSVRSTKKQSPKRDLPERSRSPWRQDLDEITSVPKVVCPITGLCYCSNSLFEARRSHVMSALDEFNIPNHLLSFNTFSMHGSSSYRNEEAEKCSRRWLMETLNWATTTGGDQLKDQIIDTWRSTLDSDIIWREQIIAPMISSVASDAEVFVSHFARHHPAMPEATAIRTNRSCHVGCIKLSSNSPKQTYSYNPLQSLAHLTDR